MASRASGRRQDPGHRRPAGRPSLLMLDHLESGLFRGPPDGADGAYRADSRAWPDRPDRPAGRRRSRRLRGLGPGVRRLAADGRVLAVAAIVAIALAVLAGNLVPLHSTQAAPARPRQAPSLAPAAPTTPASALTPGPPGPARPSATSRGGRHPDQGRSPRARQTAVAGAPAAASPSSSAIAATRPAVRASAVIVRFTVRTLAGGIFQGEVQIVNEGTQPLADWQVAVTLPGDRVIAVANASGFAVNGILLLEPAGGARPLPAGGGVLNIFFTAVGSQPVPGACTFNQAPCG
jgi:hypothetical protein